MRYFLIAGEASGDLHAAHLMRALRQEDTQAEFTCIGGDLMQQEGGDLLLHYRSLAFMGFLPVLLHLPTILKGLRLCKTTIQRLQPDAVILIDYPGFNLRIAKFVAKQALCPVYYYIAPKIWAWKEHRIQEIRQNVDRLFSILPFEKTFFEGKHGYPISYVGNPTVDEIALFQEAYGERTMADFAQQQGLHPTQPIIALLAGSRQQEIKNNLSRMCRAAAPWIAEGYQLVLAGAPAITPAEYEQWLADVPEEVRPKVVYEATYPLLQHATAALVTSGTATLETALFSVPQVVCYYIAGGKVVNWLRRHFLKVPFISLVNLICQRAVVPELIADEMTTANIRQHLRSILPEGKGRAAMLRDYEEMREKLGGRGAALRAAQEMVHRLWERSDYQPKRKEQ